MEGEPNPEEARPRALARLGRGLARRAWLVILAFAVALAAAAIYGADVSRHLVGAGFEVPGSESQQAMEAVARHFGVGSADVFVLYRVPDGSIRDPRASFAVLDSLQPVLDDPGVQSVTTVYDSAQEELVSRDGRETLAIVSLARGGEEKLQTFRRIEPLLRAAVPPLEARVGGVVAFTAHVQDEAPRDVAAAEAVALPIALLLTLVFFRTAVAALLPVAIGAFALSGSSALVRLCTHFGEISIFAMNVGAFLGLGLSIDYALLMVQRFREELARDDDVEEAVATTLDTAGRAVWLSGGTVALSLLSLLPVPLPILRSLTIGGVLAVASALFASMLLLPALLAVLGPNVNRWRVGRGDLGGEPGRFWLRVGEISMRHPGLAAAGSAALLLLLASPALHMRSAMPDSRALPAGSEVRDVDAAIDDPAQFDPGVASAVPIVAETRGDALEPANLRALRAYAAALAAVPGVAGVRTAFADLDPDALAPDALARAATQEPTATRVRRMTDGAASLLVVQNPHPWRSAESVAVVEALRRVPSPGLDVKIGGATALMLDTMRTLREAGLVAVLLVAASNFLILLRAFRSIALPIKAVLMNLLSLVAGYGVLVLVFQDGWFAHLLRFDPLDGIDPTIPVVMFAIMFGLSMDYEVFILSRIQEEWRRTRDNRTSVIQGIARTGRTVTSAAMILLVVVGAFVAGDLVFVKEMGVGLGTAIILDVTIVRAFLMPATMQLLGDWNWWAPRWIRAQVDAPGERGVATAPRARSAPP